MIFLFLCFALFLLSDIYFIIRIIIFSCFEFVYCTYVPVFSNFVISPTDLISSLFSYHPFSLAWRLVRFGRSFVSLLISVAIAC